jgi:hypothetical protein
MPVPPHLFACRVSPRTAEWLQLAAPIRNPYFGAEMLDCGSEVKP